MQGGHGVEEDALDRGAEQLDQGRDAARLEDGEEALAVVAQVVQGAHRALGGLLRGESKTLVWFSGEPCFQGRPIRYFTNPSAFTLIPLQGYVPKPFISILLSPLPEGDSIQVLPAVSFWKRERYRLSYRGWALKARHVVSHSTGLFSSPIRQSVF